MNPELTLKDDEWAIFRLRMLYRQYGYTFYKMSEFEEYDLYVRNKSFLNTDNILTFTRTDGKLMALKPDVTLSIVKNTKDGQGALQKVYYSENIYRPSSTSRDYREIMQVGLECIGELDLWAMAEVVLLAARSLETISSQYLLDLSHLGFVAGLLDQAQVKAEDRAELMAFMGKKNVPALTTACQRLGMEEDMARDLCRLATMYAPPAQALEPLREMVRNRTMAWALSELESVCALVGDVSSHLRLDFSVVNDMNYYNGLIFRGYLPGLPCGILAGGRYDNLLKKMGKTSGAIGFGVYLDLLEHVEQKGDNYDADVLLLYGPDTPASQVARAAGEHRRAGLSVRTERQIPPGLKFRWIKEVG